MILIWYRMLSPKKKKQYYKRAVFTIICVDFSGYKIQCRSDLEGNYEIYAKETRFIKIL